MHDPASIPLPEAAMHYAQNQKICTKVDVKIIQVSIIEDNGYNPLQRNKYRTVPP
jgi:hypothetical protein